MISLVPVWLSKFCSLCWKKKTSLWIHLLLLLLWVLQWVLTGETMLTWDGSCLLIQIFFLIPAPENKGLALNSSKLIFWRMNSHKNQTLQEQQCINVPMIFALQGWSAGEEVALWNITLYSISTLRNGPKVWWRCNWRASFSFYRPQHCTRKTCISNWEEKKYLYLIYWKNCSRIVNPWENLALKCKEPWLSRVTNSPEAYTAIQRDLNRLEWWADKKFSTKFNKKKCRVLYLEKSNPRYQSTLGESKWRAAWQKMT